MVSVLIPERQSPKELSSLHGDKSLRGFGFDKGSLPRSSSPADRYACEQLSSLKTAQNMNFQGHGGEASAKWWRRSMLYKLTPSGLRVASHPLIVDLAGLSQYESAHVHRS